MIEADKAKFSEIISALAIATRTEADEALFAAYWMALEDLPIEAIALAGRRALRECKFFPAAVELRERSGVASVEDRAVIAWDKFQQAVIRHGYYASVQFDDPAINATIRNLGGWIRVCEMPAEEFDKWLRKDFERVYASLSRSGVGLEHGAYLPGYFEKENAIAGQPVAPPVLIETGLATTALPAPSRSHIPQLVLKRV